MDANVVSPTSTDAKLISKETCPSCKAAVPPSAYFCLNCGKRIRNKPPSTSIMTQIGVYALSVLLPPFGLIPAIKYLRQKDTKSRMVGWVAVVLTIVVSVVTIYYSIVIYKEFVQLLNAQLNSQLNLNQLQ